MASSNNLDALSQDGALPFGHPGRRFDDTPEGFEPSPPGGPRTGAGLHAGRRRPEWSTTAPGTAPLSGSESMTAVYTDDPALVSGCADCLELVGEDLYDDNEYRGYCLHCRQEITA